MTTTSYLTAGDLAALLDGAYAYDGRGPVLEVHYLDRDGRRVAVERLAVVSEERGLTVFARALPETEAAYGPGDQAGGAGGGVRGPDAAAEAEVPPGAGGR